MPDSNSGSRHRASAKKRRPRQVLVIGGSSGVGRATVERFAHGGDHVWFTYRSGRQRALALVAELSGYGRQVQAFEFDQGNWSSHECLLLQLPGPVDVLVNNATASYPTIEHYVPGPDHRREAALLWINSVGPLWLIRQLLPGMIDQGHGTIVNVSGTGRGDAAPPGSQVADGMSRAALASLTTCLAAELAQQPIGVFAVCPRTTATVCTTDTTRTANTAYPADPAKVGPSTLTGLPQQRQRESAAGPPRGRVAQPAEIAEVVWWLASDTAQVPRGAVIAAPRSPGAYPGLSADWPANTASGGLSGHAGHGRASETPNRKDRR